MRRSIFATALVLPLAGCAAWTEYAPSTKTAAATPLRGSAAMLIEPTDFVKGFEALRAGNPAAAEPFLARHLAAQPGDPYALLSMGAVMAETGRPDEAISYYRLAARYGGGAPLGPTVNAGDADARTVAELALRNMRSLDGAGVTLP